MNSKTVITRRPNVGAFSTALRLLRRVFVRMLAGLLCAGSLAGRLEAAEQPDSPRDFLLMKLYEATLKAVDQRLETAAGSPTPEPGSGNPTNSHVWTQPDYGCALWLDVARSTNNPGNVVVTLHNTIPGTNYQVLSKTNLNDASWVTETNVAGTGGQDWTSVTIPMLQRPSLFFIASETFVLATNFAGMDSLETEKVVPDSMGAVGPNHFVELLNGRIAVFAKSNGARLESLNSSNFFAVQSQGTNFPTGSDGIDPRILYDHEAGRWVACAIDAYGSKHVMLAVTTNDSPTGLASNWVKYLVPMYVTNADTDYVTMGLDANGIYLTADHRLGATNAGHTVVAIKKPGIYLGTNLQTRFEIDPITNEFKVWTVQPAVNFDNVTSTAPAWLVAKGPPQLGTNYQGGAMFYRRLQWSNTTACLVDSNWISASQPSGLDYRNYYDLDGTNLTVRPYPGTGVNAPQSGTTARISLIETGSRLMNAVIRAGCLYTCQHVGLSGTNGAYAGNETGANVDRSGVQWLKLSVNGGDSLSYLQHGRIYDPTPTNTYYYFPSIAVNCASTMMLGFSGSSSNSFINAYYALRSATGPGTSAPQILKLGEDYFEDSAWGDYSATTLDPTDSLTFWTVQEYGKPIFEEGRVWGTWIGCIRDR